MCTFIHTHTCRYTYMCMYIHIFLSEYIHMYFFAHTVSDKTVCIRTIDNLYISMLCI